MRLGCRGGGGGGCQGVARLWRGRVVEGGGDDSSNAALYLSK